jgi:hypothetical protein
MFISFQFFIVFRVLFGLSTAAGFEITADELPERASRND